jgi:ribosomal protein S18 acetylase RimI-like enzyme
MPRMADEDATETIDAAMLADVLQLADLLTILFTQEADFTPERAAQERGLRLVIASPAVGRIFVARAGEAGCAVVGMVSLLFTVSTEAGAPACWLEDMIVHPDYRSSGLGSRLLDHAIAYAEAHGFARITLLTDRDNDAAIRFYRRHGFDTSQMITLRRPLKSIH